MHNPTIITVVRDPTHILGKQFKRGPDGTISKHSAVSLSFGIAVQHEVNTYEEMAALLVEVSNDPHAAIINSSFKGIAIGEEFIILSAAEIEKRLGIPQSERMRQQGVHQIEYNGKTYKAVGRFKENVIPSKWQLLDRDIDKSTPAEYAKLTTAQWVAQIGRFLPGVEKLTYVETSSTSSRVLDQGKSVGAGNSHVWIKVSNPDDIERIRSAMVVLAAEQDMTWSKSRFSRTEPDKVVAQSLTTIVDPSVWTVGRLVFDGKPTVDQGLTVEPLKVAIHHGECDALDLSGIVLPDASKLRIISGKVGVAMKLDSMGGSVRIALNDLKLDTEIETKDRGSLTVQRILELGPIGKLRCQSPFRDSTSYAAFYSTNADGIPYVFDNGTNITHWLDEFQQGDVKKIKATQFVNRLLDDVKGDSAAILEDDAIAALATLKRYKPAEYERKRSELKRANKHVSLANLDRAVKAQVFESDASETHHSYAKRLLGEMTHLVWSPIGHHGDLFVLNPCTNLWEAKPVEAMIHKVADTHDGKDHCVRAGDYKAIAEHAISLATDNTYFAEAPNGLACSGGFYRIADDAISLVPLIPEHRQRVRLPFTPVKMATPMFDEFLRQTFESKHAGEEEQQITLMQEIAGGIMLGILHKFQVAVLFYEPFGRAGKGTLEKQLRQLVPKEFVTAISPFKWGHDYHVVTLAGKRLNVVGELPENEAIPAAMFKTVLGGDLITGRHPTHRPLTFTNEAAHLFMSNHLITTKDQSEAFFARWVIVEFPNSRLRSGLPLDKNLAQNIIDNELPGIAFWALEGAARLLRNGKLSLSTAHDRLMAKWRRTTNSLEEFIHECCELDTDGQYRRSSFYTDYTQWCAENGRKPFAKGRVKELLEHNIGMGIRLVEINGYETFCGISDTQNPAKKPMTPVANRFSHARNQAGTELSGDASNDPTEDAF
jgi:P4 family phage/plasmid primase-like protien